MSDLTKSLMSAALGAATMLVLMSVLPGSIAKKAFDLIEKCERTLPRDQTCMIIAVPKTEKK